MSRSVSSWEPKKGVQYYYVDHNYPGFVWLNAYVFGVLHLLYAYGFYLTITRISWSNWIFSK